MTQQMQNKTSIQLSMDDYEKFIKSYDLNSDGKIDYGVCTILNYLVLVPSLRIVGKCTIHTTV